MNDKRYNKLKGIRRSDLWVIKKSPLHFKYNLEHPAEKTEALVFGSAVHKYILEPKTFFKEYAVLPDVDRRTKDGKEAYNDFVEKNKGKEVITQEAFHQIKDMAEVLKADELIAEFLDGAEVEKVFTWVDAETNEKCKIKADIFKRQNGVVWILDYKTTTSCAGFDFERSAKKYGYRFQAGMYTEGVETNLLEKCSFAFIAQEKTPPYAYRIYWCSPEFVESGKREFHELLDKYHTCKKYNIWHGYDNADLLEEVYQ